MSVVLDENNYHIYCLEESSNVNINMPVEGDPMQNTLMHLAVISKNVNLINKLYAMGADIYIPNINGETACDLLAKELYIGINYIMEGMMTLDNIIEMYKMYVVNLKNENDNLKNKLNYNKIINIPDSMSIVYDKKRKREETSSTLESKKTSIQI